MPVPCLPGLATTDPVHVDNLTAGTSRNRFFKMPAFRFSMEEVPTLATHLLSQFISDHPGDLLYMEVAVEKVLQYIWIMADPEARADGIDLPLPRPSQALQLMLILAHQYKVYHQVNRMAFYLHPFRFIQSVLDALEEGNRTIAVNTPDYGRLA